MMKVSYVGDPFADGEMSNVIYAPAFHNFLGTFRVLTAQVCVSAEKEKRG
jgi:hypothetical protein